MSKKSKKKSFQPQNKNSPQGNRDNKVGNKELRKQEEPELLFSFKYFDTGQIPPGQHFKDWEADNLASRALEEIKKLLSQYQNQLKQEEKELKESLCEEFMGKLLQVLNDFDKSTKNQGLLSDLFEKLVSLSKITKTEAIGKKDRTNPLGIYPNFNFEEQSEFKKPSFPLPEGASWATIKRIGGQKPRVAGFIFENVFYVVFLDKEHKFWSSDE